MSELYHFGVKGMKWGVRKRIEKQRLKRKLDNFGPNQDNVLGKVNRGINQDKTINDAWSKAFKAGKGSKEWSRYERCVKDFRRKDKDEYIDAWIKDNNIKKLSDEGRQFIEDNLFRI